MLSMLKLRSGCKSERKYERSLDQDCKAFSFLSDISCSVWFLGQIVGHGHLRGHLLNGSFACSIVHGLRGSFWVTNRYCSKYCKLSEIEGGTREGDEGLIQEGDEVWTREKMKLELGKEMNLQAGRRWTFSLSDFRPSTSKPEVYFSNTVCDISANSTSCFCFILAFFFSHDTFITSTKPAIKHVKLFIQNENII